MVNNINKQQWRHIMSLLFTAKRQFDLLSESESEFIMNLDLIIEWVASPDGPTLKL